MLMKPASQTVFYSRLSWARKYLADMGYMNGSTRGVWTLTPEGREAYPVRPEDVADLVKHMPANLDHPAGKTTSPTGVGFKEEADEEDPATWQTKLHQILHSNTFSPVAFARLVQRRLRESGFAQLNVDGRAEDGTIEGNGTSHLNPLISAKVLSGQTQP